MTAWPIALPAARTGSVDVLAFGENSLDFVGVGPRLAPGADKASLSSFTQLVGGQAATAAVGCARQGWRARYIGSLGDDAAASAIRRTLDAEGVECVALARRGGGNRIAMILVDETTGDRSVFEFRHEALRVAPAEVPLDNVTSARIAMVDATHADASIVVAEAARAARVPVVIDIDSAVPQAARLLSLVDVIVVPETFARTWTGAVEPGRALGALAREFPAPAIVMTMGPDGSLASIAGREIRTPAFAVDVVDTTGAGDAFRAGLVSGWLAMGDRADAETVLAWANATAALNCRALGAQTSLPDRPSVDALVTKWRHGQSK